MNFAYGLFLIVNTLLAFYIVLYAFIFLSRTKNYPDRRPWELLFAGAFFFLIYQIVGLVSVYGGFIDLDLSLARIILEFAYAALVLMAFITQSQLILLSDMILITRKVRDRKVELAREERHKIPGSKNEKAFLALTKTVTPDDEIKFELGSKEVKEEMKDEHFHSELLSEKELVKSEKKKSK